MVSGEVDVAALVGPERAGRLRVGQAEFMAPMLATFTATSFSDPDWVFERKLDGVRVLVVRGQSGTRLYSRTRKPMNAPYPELVEALDVVAPAGMVADGEIVAFDGEQTSFSRLQARIGLSDPARARASGVEVFVYLFDLLAVGGHDLTGLTLLERKRVLAAVVEFGDPVRLSEHRVTDGREYLREACGRGWEGLIAKRAVSTYWPGQRSKDWLKFKCVREQELIIGGWTDPTGSRTGFGALLLGYYERDQLRYAGKVGTGFDRRALAGLLARFATMGQAESPFADPVAERGAHWVRPDLVAQVGFAEWTPDHRLRHPRYLGLREDKPAVEVVREYPAPETPPPSAADEPANSTDNVNTNVSAPHGGGAPSWQDPSEDEIAALDTLGAKGTWDVAGRQVVLTNLDKVLFPAGVDATVVTKRDLVRYYAQIAPHLLPYLWDRPVNLQRFPDGVGRPGFWQKQLPEHAPDWLTRWRNPDAGVGETERYAVLDSVASLVWMANHAAVELHPWTSRSPRTGEPTWALIDIDPGTSTTFAQVLELAVLYRTALRHLDVVGAAKVTGRRGVQIWVPVRSGYSFGETRGWVEKVSRAVGRTLPGLVSWEWHTDRRGGLARLDYTQNVLNKTLVAPFSPRPAPGAPVSMPITWDELDDPDLRPDRWTIHTALHRVRTAGDPLAALIGRQQALPPL